MVLDGRPTLHSNLVIFKSKSRRSKTGCFYLYIPIWLYSNSTAQKPKTHIVKSFTFQSGYIQIGCAMIKSHLFTVLYIPIWLYSNPLANTEGTRLGFTLHSNLVIFKSCFIKVFGKEKALYIPIWLYSNDDILNLIISFYGLYIPIWLYSNTDKRV